MARQEAQWRASLSILPCSVCGAVQDGADTIRPQPPSPHRSNDEVEDLRSYFYMSTPADTSNESDILIGDKFQSGYGAVDPKLNTLPVKPDGKGKTVRSSNTKR